MYFEALCVIDQGGLSFRSGLGNQVVIDKLKNEGRGTAASYIADELISRVNRQLIDPTLQANFHRLWQYCLRYLLPISPECADRS